MSPTMLRARRSLAKARLAAVAACKRFYLAGRKLDEGETHEERQKTWRENEAAENALDKAGAALVSAEQRVEGLRRLRRRAS